MGYNDYGNRNFGGNKMQSHEDKSFTPKSVKILKFYNSDNKVITELFDKTAQDVAESFLGKNKKGCDIGVTSSQLRKIFDEVKRFEQLLLVSPGQWEKQLPYIKMIKSKVAYSVARASKEKEKAGIYKNLEEFLSSSIDLIKKEEDYHVFVSLFEATYGFYYEKMIAAGLKD